jgi:hypothetical protein
MNTRDEKAHKVLALVEAFIKEHEIRCYETIYQCDHVILAASDFITDLCEEAGFLESEEDEEEEEEEPSSNGHYIGLDR